jgi:hypothetical protein
MFGIQMELFPRNTGLEKKKARTTPQFGNFPATICYSQLYNWVVPFFKQLVPLFDPTSVDTGHVVERLVKAHRVFPEYFAFSLPLSFHQ